MMRCSAAALGRLRFVMQTRAGLLIACLLLLETSGCRFTSETLSSRHIRIAVNKVQESENVETLNDRPTNKPAEDFSEDAGGQNVTPTTPATTETTSKAMCSPVSPLLDQVIVLPSPWYRGAPLRVVATTRRPHTEKVTLVVVSENGKAIQPERSESWAFRPRAVSVYFSHLASGRYDARLMDQRGRALACAKIEIPPADAAPTLSAPASGVWEVTRDWTPALEDLYSVFVAKLFYVRPGGAKGWRPLHQATRDPFRNILYGSFGLEEDNPKSDMHVVLEPDCADSPFQLRAYFSWKMGLPFMFNQCNRGSSMTGPKCYTMHSGSTKRFDGVPEPISRFNAFVSTHVGWKVHSGNGRTVPSSNTGDVYPIDLTLESLRPGAVYVDAGGHVILVSQVEPQTDSRLGAVYGVDAHPDRTVTHKQFGVGTFVFNYRVPTDGFKMFRPVVRDGDQFRFLSNQELTDRGFSPWSNSQSKLKSKDAFYDTVGHILNPIPVDPIMVLHNKIAILHKAMLERVEAVALGVAYMKENNWRQMAMPNGAAIFQTEGPWEIYSTPARDMRVFLAIDDVMTFPKQVARNRKQYSIPADTSEQTLLKQLETTRDEALRKLEIAYERSDGSSWKLSLKDVIERQESLEMAYNPNDCIEIRWGALKNSEEMSTCRRKAPPDQRFKMKLARPWFASRRRPDQR